MGCVFYLRLVRVEGGKVSSCGLCVLSKSCQVEREKVSGLCILSKGCLVERGKVSGCQECASRSSGV